MFCAPSLCTAITMFTQMTNLLSSLTSVCTSCQTKQNHTEPLNNNKVRNLCTSRRTRSSSACHVISARHVISAHPEQPSRISSALPSVTGLLLYISPLTSRIILAVSHLPSLFLCLWLCSACMPFQDRSSNSILLASFISLSSSFSISFHFVLEPRGFQVWNSDQQQQHLPETCW